MDFEDCLSPPVPLSVEMNGDRDPTPHPSEGNSKRPAADYPVSPQREKRRKTDAEPEGEATQREEDAPPPRHELHDVHEPFSPPTPQTPSPEESSTAASNEASKLGLSCVFCGEVFSLQRQPFLLPCGHSACQDDLKQLTLRGSSAVCPKDRQPIALNEAELNNFPLNEPMLEVFKDTLPGSGECSIQSLLNPSICCAVCGKDDATKFCISCPAPYGDLCKGCFEKEHDTYVSKRHQVLESKVHRLGFMPCQVHTDKGLRLYCKRCKKLACEDCKNYGEHRKHQDELDLTSDLASDLEQHFQTLIVDARKCIENCDGELQRLTGSLTDVQLVAVSKTALVKNNFEELANAVKSRQASLLAQIELAAEQRRSLLQQHRQKVAMARARLESVVQYCTIILKSNVSQLVEKRDMVHALFQKGQNEAKACSELSPDTETRIEVELPRERFVDFIDAYGLVRVPNKQPSAAVTPPDVTLLPAGASAESSSKSSAPLISPATFSSSLSSPAGAVPTLGSASNLSSPKAASTSSSAAGTPADPAAADGHGRLNGTPAAPPLNSGQRSTSSPVLSHATHDLSQLTPIPVSANTVLDALRSNNMNLFEQMVQDPSLSREELISVFFGAVRTCQIAVVDWLIRTKRVDPAWCHPTKHYSALHLAAATESVDLVKLLIGFGVDVKGRDTYGATPFLWAAQGGCLAVAQYLVDFGADFDDQDLQGNRALHVAARNGNLEIVKWLVEKKRSPPGLLNKSGLSGLDMAKRKAVTTGKDMSEVIRYLERVTPVLLD